MKRRGFLKTIGLGAASAPLLRATDDSTVPAVEPRDDQMYFTEARLYEAVGTRELARPTGVEVIAYNFPGFHPSPWMEARFGKGWSEFEVLKNARGLFPGHAMPRIPLWGYFNEADPEWAQREIDTAADYGLDGWLIDWYWHEGTMFYHEQLERGFLKAANNGRLKFALMWANHDWKNVYPARNPETAAILLPQTHTVADCVKVADYCIEHYFHAPNYLRVDGALLFGFFDFPLLLKQLG